MLVLSRKQSEQILIGDQITVTVLEVMGNRVKLGISAPSSIPVHRQEICVAMQTPIGTASPEMKSGEGLDSRQPLVGSTATAP